MEQNIEKLLHHHACVPSPPPNLIEKFEEEKNLPFLISTKIRRLSSHQPYFNSSC